MKCIVTRMESDFKLQQIALTILKSGFDYHQMMSACFKLSFPYKCDYVLPILYI